MTKLKKTLIATAIATVLTSFSSATLAGVHTTPSAANPPRAGVLHPYIFMGVPGFKKLPVDSSKGRRMRVDERTKRYSNNIDLVKIRAKQTFNFKGNFGKGKSEYQLQQMKKDNKDN